MAGLRFVFLLCIIIIIIINPSFQEGMNNILGDPVEFAAAKSCQKRGAKLTHRLEDDSTRPVAHWDGVWEPGPGYRGRMSPNDSVTLNSSNMNDNGLYELTCGPEEEALIHLYVVVASEVSVTEGGPAKLHFHHISVGGTVRYIRCERDGELVFEVDLSSGVIRYGTGFEERASVSPDWRTQGDFSPTLQRVQLEDQGDYFFYALDKDRERAGGKPVAVRMRVKKTNPDQITTPPPPVCPTQRPAEEKMGILTVVGIITIAIVAVMCLVAAVFGCVWWLKPCRSNVSSGPGGERPAPDVEMGLLTERGPAGSHVNGALRG